MASMFSKLSARAFKMTPYLVKRVGPHGETLAAIACGAAVALPLFAPRDWLGFAQYLPGASLLVLTALLLLLAVYFLLAAVHHAERVVRNQRTVLKREQRRVERKKYQVTPTRVLVLKAAGVPRDITGVLEKMFKALSDKGAAQKLPPTPRHKEEFITWLSRDVGVGRTRVDEFRALILKYSECESGDVDKKVAEGGGPTALAGPRPPAPKGAGATEVTA